MTHDEIRQKYLDFCDDSDTSTEAVTSMDAEIKSLCKSSTFKKIDVDVMRYAGNGRNEIVVTVCLLLTGEMLYFSSKEFLEMSEGIQNSINKYGDIEPADLEIAKSMVRLYMKSELTQHDISKFGGYSNQCSGMFEEFYFEVIEELIHNEDSIAEDYGEFLNRADKYFAIFEQNFRGDKACVIFTKENLMDILEIKNPHSFTEVMKAWKQRGYLYVSGGKSSKERCQVKYHGKQCYAVVIPPLKNGNSSNSSDSGNSGNSGNISSVQKVIDCTTTPAVLALPPETKNSNVN